MRQACVTRRLGLGSRGITHTRRLFTCVLSAGCFNDDFTLTVGFYDETEIKIGRKRHNKLHFWVARIHQFPTSTYTPRRESVVTPLVPKEIIWWLATWKKFNFIRHLYAHFCYYAWKPLFLFHLWTLQNNLGRKVNIQSYESKGVLKLYPFSITRRQGCTWKDFFAFVDC